MSQLDVHVLVIPSWSPTVGEPWRGRFFLDQAQSLAEAGHTVGVAAIPSRPGTLHQLRELRPPYSCRPNWSRSEGLAKVALSTWGVLGTMSGARRLALARNMLESYIARSGRPDILHAHGSLVAGEIAVGLRRSHRTPVVLTEHTSAVSQQRFLPHERRRVIATLHGADRVLAVSPHLATRLRSLAPTIQAGVVPNVVDTELFQPGRRRGSRAEFSLAMVAALVPNKRVDLALRAVAAQPANEGIRLRIAGQGPERDGLEGLARQLGIDRRVEWLGPLPRTAVRDLLQDSDALVSSSEQETFGVTIAEAFACGLPVLATRSGGPDGLVTTGRGILVEPNSTEALARGLTALWERHQDFDRQAIRSFAVATFSPRSIAQQLHEEYQALLRPSGPHSAEEGRNP